MNEFDKNFHINFSPFYAMVLLMICFSILESCASKEPTIIEPPVESCINEIELPEKECILVA